LKGACLAIPNTSKRSDTGSRPASFDCGHPRREFDRIRFNALLPAARRDELALADRPTPACLHQAQEVARQLSSALIVRSDPALCRRDHTITSKVPLGSRGRHICDRPASHSARRRKSGPVVRLREDFA
jgi:hypothetical protein